jgi:hypothetical protein
MKEKVLEAIESWLHSDYFNEYSQEITGRRGLTVTTDRTPGELIIKIMD